MPARACHRCPPLQAAVDRVVANRWLRLYFCVHNPQCLVGGRRLGRRVCLHDVTEVTGNRRLVAYWLVPLEPLNRAWPQADGCCPAHQPSETESDQQQSETAKEHAVREEFPPTGDVWAGTGYGDASWQCSQDQASLNFLDSLSVVLSCDRLEEEATSEGVCAHTSSAPSTTIHQQGCSSPPTECKPGWEWGQQGTSTSPRGSVVQHHQDGLLRPPVARNGSPSRFSCEAESWLSMAEECALTESLLEGLSEPWDTTCKSQGDKAGNWEELPGLMESISVGNGERLQLHNTCCSHSISKRGGSIGRDSPSDTHHQSPLLLGPATPTTTQCWRGCETAGGDADQCQEGDSPLLFPPTPKAGRKCLATAPPASAIPLCRTNKVISQQTLFNTCQDCNTPVNGCVTSSHVTAVADTPLSNASHLDQGEMESSPELFAHTPGPRTPSIPVTPNTSSWLHAVGHSWVSPNIL